MEEKGTRGLNQGCYPSCLCNLHSIGCLAQSLDYKGVLELV